ncbi:MAG: type VI secretion system tip protein VgrG [Planctomycetia bacterium]|nr:type VI secretion system tip protein VgrG [Planctomycetia bacterium]
MSAAVVSTQVGRALTLNTPLGPNVLVPVGFQAKESLSHPFRVTVRARAKRGTRIDFDQILGRPAAIRLAAPKRNERHFHGIVSRFTQGGTDHEFTHYFLELVPHFWLLTQKFQSRIFVRKSTPEILKEILGDIPREVNLHEKYPKREFCAQYRESDFAFASRLMEEEGIYYFFKHTNAGHTMVLADGTASHPDLPTPIRLRNLSEVDRLDDEAIHDLGKSQQIVPGRVQLRDHHFQLPHETLAAESTIGSELTVGQASHRLASGPIPSLEVYEYPGDYARRFDAVDFGGGAQPASLRTMTEENRRLAKVRAQERAVPAIELTGSGNAHSLVAGHRATFAAADQPSQAMKADGKYIVTSISHDMEASSNYRSNDSGKFDYTNRFTCIPAGTVYRPARETPRPRIDGVQTAVVVGPPGEEIFTDKHGRVKLHFHWDRSGSMDGSNSPWVRVATPHAGKGFGGVCIPRVGEEVIVSFLDGDPDRPIVVGRVYNERETPPFKLPEQKMVSGMKSNTYPGGGGFNEMSFDDTKGKERMFVHAQYNQDTVVGNNRTAKVGVDDFEEVGNNQTIKIGVNQTETIGAKQTISVGTDQTETIGTNQTTTVGENIVITAGTSITLKCGASMITMNQAGLITISGTIVAVAGAANCSMTAPVTNVTGGVLLTAMGAVTRVQGFKLAQLKGARTDVEASTELSLKGAPIKLN